MPRLAWILLIAATAFAEDFETRYHEAYKIEVVDGKVADAASRYLDLLREKELPPHLKAQTEFRFAVTCALLGRPDEARARLAALAAAQETPAALKPQIEEYRKSLAEVEPGSAAEQRIAELVYQLGREYADDSVEPAVYRDFEIMGSAAVPHLMKLLDHPDQQLREHAFRILCRMGAPGLAARWDPKWKSTLRDLAYYLRDRPGETAVIEERLAEMPPAVTDSVLSPYAPGNPWSPAFLRAHAARTEKPDVVAVAVVSRQDLPGNRETVVSWLADGGPGPLADEAAVLLARYTKELYDPKLFTHALLRLASCAKPPAQEESNGVVVAAAKQPADVLLDVLSRLLDGDGQWRYTYASVVARALAAQELGEADARRFATLLETWISKGGPDPLAVRGCATRLPADAAARFLAKYFAKTEANQAAQVVAAIQRPEDAAFLRVAIENIAPEHRQSLFNDVTQKLAASQSPAENRAAVARMLPELRGKVSSRGLAERARWLAPALPPEEAIALVVALVEMDPQDTLESLYRANWNTPEDGIYRRDVAVPALPKVWPLLSDGGRGALVLQCLKMLKEEGPRALGEARSTDLASFLLPRLDRLPDDARQGYAIVSGLPDLFPLEAWLPASPGYLWTMGQVRISGEPEIDLAVRDRAARALVADPSKVTDTVLVFLENSVSQDVRVECATELYRKADGKLMAMLLAHRRLMPADSAVLEEAFERLKDADLAVVAQLGFRLAEVRPSEKLFKLAERLLASPDRGYVLQGIALARSLGRDALLQPLLAKLDSMDAEVRTKAREAIDSILELKRIKEEVATRLAGLR